MSALARFVTVILIGLLGIELLAQPVETQQTTVSLPTLSYLGSGPQTFNNEPGWNFIVKRLYPFRFEFVPGPTYTAVKGEDVWASMGTNGAPPAVYHQSVTIGPVQAGCIINYVAIDDQLDGRVNQFTLNGIIIHTIPEGMVTSGKFNIPQDGELGYMADDSIGLYLNVCGEREVATPIPPTSRPTLTPTPTVEATGTAVATIMPTQTMTPPSGTPASTGTPAPTETPGVGNGTATPTPIATVLATPTSTPFFTPTPEATTIPVNEPTATPTRVPKKVCTRINFEISGDVARAGEYRVVEAGGRLLYVWTAEAGWQDSGWQYGIDISFDAVHVNVFYVPTDGSEPIQMVILNPAPDTSYGWLASGMCHALEVGWP